MLRQSLKKKKKILIIDDWGVMEGVVRMDGKRARGEMERVERKS